MVVAEKSFLDLAEKVNLFSKENRARIFQRFWNPCIDSKEQIPQANVAWWPVQKGL
jgi:hypothetical protein